MLLWSDDASFPVSLPTLVSSLAVAHLYAFTDDGSSLVPSDRPQTPKGRFLTDRLPAQTEVLADIPTHQLQGVANQATRPPQFPEVTSPHGIFYRARPSP